MVPLRNHSALSSLDNLESRRDYLDSRDTSRGEVPDFSPVPTLSTDEGGTSPCLSKRGEGKTTEGTEWVFQSSRERRDVFPVEHVWWWKILE